MCCFNLRGIQSQSDMYLRLPSNRRNCRFQGRGLSITLQKRTARVQTKVLQRVSEPYLLTEVTVINSTLLTNNRSTTIVQLADRSTGRLCI